MIKRTGLTLVEALVCMAIFAVLLGLILVSLQSVREGAARTESQNHLRQIAIGSLNFASAHQGRFPSLEGSFKSPIATGYGFLVPIRPYLEQEFQPPPNLLEDWPGTDPYPLLPVVQIYLSPADPTINRNPLLPLSSYAVNAQAFQGDPTMATFRDGTSNTIMLAEHYSTNCGRQVAREGWLYDPGTEVSFGYVIGFMGVDEQGAYGMFRRASFADGNLEYWAGCGDYAPDSEGIPTTTFQTAPSISTCDPRMAQTPHRSGMLIALADGSVRTLAPSVAPATYWALVTPAGGEAIGDW